jgi:hypothetical protein
MPVQFTHVYRNREIAIQFAPLPMSNFYLVLLVFVLYPPFPVLTNYSSYDVNATCFQSSLAQCFMSDFWICPGGISNPFLNVLLKCLLL